MNIKLVTLMNENNGEEEKVIEFTGTFYSHLKPWMEFQEKYKLSPQQVAEEVVAALQMNAWADVFDGLEPLALIKEKLEAEK
jgi:hypothetical protein